MKTWGLYGSGFGSNGPWFLKKFNHHYLLYFGTWDECVEGMTEWPNRHFRIVKRDIHPVNRSLEEADLR